MKKVTLFAVAAMAVMSLASCKKNHTCTCTGSGSSYSSITVAKSSKKGGAAWCSSGNSVTYTVVETTPSGTTTSTGTSTSSCTFA